MDILNDFRSFVRRHVGPSPEEISEMLAVLGLRSLDELTDRTIPKAIRLQEPLPVRPSLTEAEVLDRARRLASSNRVFRSYLGMGYSDCITPPVILRNVLENPGWYTQYTPYQAEIAQGRLEALLNFQTLVSDLTGLEISNASLLDEATAAAEAMGLSFAARGNPTRHRFLVLDDCHPQTIDVIRTRAHPLEIEILTGPLEALPVDDRLFGVLLQYPATDGKLMDYSSFCRRVHAAGGLVVAATDLLALTLLTPPGEWGADVAVGNSQRFGVPLGFGGPHAAFLATSDAFKRMMPGRLVGVSRDVNDQTALRLALQTREQHIRRERATSNICTAQVLLAVMAAMYAVYHGPPGLRAIACQIHRSSRALRDALAELGYHCRYPLFFDTLRIDTPDGENIVRRAAEAGMNFRVYPDHSLGIALDETTTESDLSDILQVFAGDAKPVPAIRELVKVAVADFPAPFKRRSRYLTHPVFNTHHSETEMLRYLFRLQSRDLSLVHSMIPLGSCTMKLNGSAEMMPVSWPEFCRLHPFAPAEQTEGFRQLLGELEDQLSEITGLPAVSLQPNAGSQGEYAGLLVIRAHHAGNGGSHRNLCLIPESAHGTNPASAIMAGFRVATVRCDEQGNVDLADLESKAAAHRDTLAALMITYPSTHGVFEEGILEICRIIHDHGGQVYMDGANLNALVGLCRPGDLGIDVCHLNLHKTFCIPHGGGGPGAGPIAVASHLAPFLPSHRFAAVGGAQAIGPVSAAPWGSALILPISWAYIHLMGSAGLKEATRVAILNANYVARRLEPHYPVLYKGRNGMVAHECILDLRRFKKSVGIDVSDLAKRLMDYGFHAPTVSWPVVETVMVEPTESESKAELDRFCDAMISIREEIREVEAGMADPRNNVLKNAPHTAWMLAEEPWNHPYTREKAAFPAAWLREYKFWPPVGRIDNTWGDRNLFCTCPPVESLLHELR